MSNNVSDIHMSNKDSIDEETKRIIAKAHSNDSSESNKPVKKPIPEDKDNDGIEWETNEKETPDSEW